MSGSFRSIAALDEPERLAAFRRFLRVGLALILLSCGVGALAQADEDPPDPQIVANLREQLRIAQRTQAEQMREIRSLRSEIDRFRQENERLEAELNQAPTLLAELHHLQSERAALQSRLTAAEGSLEKLRLEFQEREQQGVIENRASKSKADHLQRQLDAAKVALAQATEEQDRLRQVLLEEKGRRSPEVTERPDPPEEVEEVEEVEVEDPFTVQREIAPPVEVIDVSANRRFLLLSGAGVPGLKEGYALLLSRKGEPLVEVEILRVDEAGLSLAQVTRTVRNASPVQEGDLLSVGLRGSVGTPGDKFATDSVRPEPVEGRILALPVILREPQDDRGNTGGEFIAGRTSEEPR